jgi:protein TonB
MRSAPSLPAIAIALLLHAALLAIVAAGLSARTDKPAEPLPMKIELAPVQRIETPVTPPVPLPVAPAEPAPEKKIAPKPRPILKPAKPVNPRPQITPEVNVPEAAFAPTPAPSVTSAPPAPAPPPAPSAPAKTSVSIPASYAASNRKPVYPSLSRRYEEQGAVVLRVFVKADGSAGQVEIKSSSGYALLDESAKSAVQEWRFQPATSDGKAVADWFLIPIPFTLQN